MERFELFERLERFKSLERAELFELFARLERFEERFELFDRLDGFELCIFRVPKCSRPKQARGDVRGRNRPGEICAAETGQNKLFAAEMVSTLFGSSGWQR